MKNRRTTSAVALVLLVIMVLPPMTRAQSPTPVMMARSENAIAADSAVEQLDLLVGRSTVIRTSRPIARVSLSTPDIADAMVTTPYELLVHGKTPGTISLLIWGDNGKITSYAVAVRRDLSPLDEQIRKIFPGESIKVAGNGKDVVLSGTVSSKYVLERATMLAVGYVDKPENVVNLLQQAESPATNQVLLRVRFAEVSRSAMQELGASFFTGPNGYKNWVGRTTTQQFPAPAFDPDKGLVFSDFLNLFAFNTEKQIGAVVKALQSKGLFQSLAEPNLITQDGKEASFLAGGEYPYPVIQNSAGNSSVTIVFKEFGVRLKFTPNITADDMIHLKVAPEVSTLDFGNGLVLSGFRVPSLSTRRTETEVELRDGQTFAIAGLLDQKVDQTLQKIPGIGDIPILGYLFKSQQYQKNSSELVVMITPHIVRRDSSGVTPDLPALDEPFLKNDGKHVPAPPPAFTNPSSANTTPASAPAAAQGAVVAPAPVAPASAPGVPAKQASSVQNGSVKPATAPQKGTDVAADAPPALAPKPAQMAPPKIDAKAIADQKKQLEAAKKQAELQQKKDQEQARKDAEQARLNAKAEEIRAREAAKVEAQRAAKEQAELARTTKADAERQAREDEIATKKAAEQAEIDRKRALEQQAEAARVKEVADRLAKEQDKHRLEQEKANKEQADREAELNRLVEQYRQLTSTTSNTSSTAK